MGQYFPLKGTDAYRLLLVFLFFKKSANISDIKNVNPNLCKKSYIFYKNIDKLCLSGYIFSTGNDKFAITPKGSLYINIYDKIHSSSVA